MGTKNAKLKIESWNLPNNSSWICFSYFYRIGNYEKNHYASTLHVVRDPAPEYLINCWEFFIFQQSCFLRIVFFLILSLLENKNLWFQVLKRFSKKKNFFFFSSIALLVEIQTSLTTFWPGEVCVPYCVNVRFSSVAQSCPTFCDPIDCSTPVFPVRHRFPETLFQCSARSFQGGNMDKAYMSSLWIMSHNCTWINNYLKTKTFIYKSTTGNSFAWWLELHALTGEGLVSSPSQWPKIPQGTSCRQKKSTTVENSIKFP